ncbi:hypothetical protein ABZ023_27665 [Streptomyces sp. NPDC006367]|uniref:hypothetical protein n=1 Tax=unclassified Streptomyces TaxID=2593676 RepID=UPI00339F417B
MRMAPLHVIPGGGHRLPTQHPEAFLTALERACADALLAGGRWHRRLACRGRAAMPLPTSRGRTADSRAS